MGHTAAHSVDLYSPTTTGLARSRSVLGIHFMAIIMSVHYYPANATIMQRPKEARSGIVGKEIEECCLTWVSATRQAADRQHRHFLVTALILFIVCHRGYEEA